MPDTLVRDPLAFLVSLVMKAPALLLAVTVHEVAHGWVANRLGDPTARLAGRLTLNPLPHIDPVGAIAFVLAGFGWAKPVPVNATNFRHPRRDMAIVAAAGPLSNFVLAFIGFALWLELQRAGATWLVTEPLGYVYAFNLALAIFNLIPLPPLDGGHFLPTFLPRRAGPLLYQLHRYGPLLLIVLVLSGATRYIIGPLFQVVTRFFLAIIRLIL